MGRLIDADSLLKKLGETWNIPSDWDGDIDETCETAFDVIENQPTAFDVEAVVKELEEQAKQYHRREKNCEDKNITVQLSKKFFGKACSYEHAIEIVRKGGVK